MSVLNVHFRHHIMDVHVLEVDMQCEGCAGQSWNNRLALFCEEIV
jgi:hypothetical protein